MGGHFDAFPPPKKKSCMRPWYPTPLQTHMHALTHVCTHAHTHTSIFPRLPVFQKYTLKFGGWKMFVTIEKLVEACG